MAKTYVPKQTSRRGRTGYLGSDIVVIGSADDDRVAPAVVGLEREATGPAAKKTGTKKSTAAK